MMKRLRFFRSIHDSRFTIHALALAATLATAGCGVETATTAATSAVIKKQEIDQGKKTMEAAQQKIEQATQQVQKQAEQTGAAADKQ
jgi:NifU-like protein involved in Fe-S cluster formation